MARGYLGKISAVISANTGDYVRKLNESAKETAAFARTVQQTLGRASSEASKSLEGIYTPIQKVERALRAAASQKLAFRGFDGAIRDVQSLQSAIAKLTDKKTIDLVVKTSGVGSLDELKRTIGVLRNQDVTIGVEGLRQQRAAIGDTKNFVVKTEVREEGKRLDDVIEALERIDAESLKKISLQVEAQQLDAAALKLRQLVSAGKLIGEPLAAAAKQYDALSLSVQAAFGPSLKRAQQSAESLGAAIDSNVTISQKKFAALRRDVELTAAAIGRLSEAEAIIGRLGNGTSLRDVAPRQFDALNEAARIQQRSSAMSGEQASGFGVGRQEAAVRRQAEILNQMRAEQERLRQRGGDTTSIDAAIERQTGRLEKQVAVWARLVGAAEKYKAAATAAQDAAQGVGQRTFIGNMGRRTDISQMGRSSPFFPGNGRGNPTGPFGPSLPEGFGGSSDAGLGRSIDDPQRRLEGLRGSITAVKSQVEQLPQAIQSGFIPAIKAAEDEFKRLAASGSATSEEIEAARQKMQSLADQTAVAANKISAARGVLTGFGGAGVDGITAGLDARAVQVFAAQMNVLQGVMAGVSGPAAGALAAAFDNVRNKIAEAADDGTIRLRATRDAIDGMIQSLGAAAAKAAGLDVSRVSNDLKRVGDVGRRGFDNFALAAQQAGFAIDDFFSVTGDLDQRIRAISNNVTQMAFILGSTKGLFVALGAVIATQVVLMYRKWANEGRSTEDRVKALNESLVAQKGIVDRLKESFDSLGDAITRSTISDKAEQNNTIQRSISSIMEQRQKAATEAVLDADPATRAARADKAKAEREREKASTFGQRAAAQAAIDQAEARIRRNERLARITPAPDDDEVRREIRRAPLGRVRPPVPDLPSGMNIDALRARREALSAPIESARQRLLDESRTGTGFDGGLRARLLGESYERLQSLAARLDAAISAIVDKDIPNLARTAKGIGDVLRTAQNVAKDAESAGTIGSSAFADQVDVAGNALRAALDELEKAVNLPAGPDREAAIEQAKQSVEAAKALGDAVKAQTPAIEAATSSILKFAEAIGRVTAEADSTLNAARSAESASRAEDIRDRTPRSLGNRLRAGASASLAQDARDEIATAAAKAQERARQSPVAIDVERQIKELDDKLKAETKPDERMRIVEQRAELQRKSEAAIREAVDGDAELNALRDKATEQEQRRQDAIAGRNLMLTPGQRAQLDLNRQIAQINEGRRSRLEEDRLLNRGAKQPQIDKEADEAIRRLRFEQIRNAAPTIFGLADSVANAVLQGPSRAALQATDVSTVEGSRELTRLLRGDDAAKDQANLVELQREANRLLDQIANNPANIAN